MEALPSVPLRRPIAEICLPLQQSFEGASRPVPPSDALSETPALQGPPGALSRLAAPLHGCRRSARTLNHLQGRARDRPKRISGGVSSSRQELWRSFRGRHFPGQAGRVPERDSTPLAASGVNDNKYCPTVECPIYGTVSRIWDFRARFWFFPPRFAFCLKSFVVFCPF